jgi:hypothetical protein
MRNQAIHSYLLDYDGSTVHILYEPGQGRWYGEAVGRTQALPTWDAQGKFAIREQFWAKTKRVNGETVPVEPYLVTRTVHLRTL